MYVGLLISMAEFWGKVASTFSDDEFVIGYEIINEPWAGIDTSLNRLATLLLLC